MEFKVASGNSLYMIDHVTTNRMEGRLNNHVPVHKHAVFHIMYFFGGKGTVTVGNETLRVQPGMLCVIRPMEPHGFQFGDGEPVDNLESTFRFMDDNGHPVESPLFDAFSGAERALSFIVPARYRVLLTEGFGRILELYDSPLFRTHCGLMVADLIARVELVIMAVLRADGGSAPELNKINGVKQFLYANRGRSVTLKEIAASVHVTPNYLCRIFKEHTGESPMGYLRTLRMREAEKLLSLTDLPVYTIAGKLGYEDPSYFARVYRAALGMSPQVYRNQLANRE